MGIQGLAQLINNISPDIFAEAENSLEDYAGKKIALDASQYLYESMAPRRSGCQRLPKVDNTSPLIRTFYSCIKLLENGIKPVYVFDGRPPRLKSDVLKVRQESREKAMIKFKEAERKEDFKAMEAIKPNIVKVTKTEVKSCKGLLKLMGIPYFFAPGEAEAQCAAFVEAGRVYATATQDIDALTYGTKVILRHLPLTSSYRFPLQELHLDKVLSALQLSLSQFIDLSILLGCDYCKGIKGIGSHKAIEMIRKYGNIENILDNIDQTKFIIPDDWLYKQARALFQNPNVIDCQRVLEFKWNKPNEEGIVQYLLGENQFNEVIIRRHLQKISGIIT